MKRPLDLTIVYYENRAGVLMLVTASCLLATIPVTVWDEGDRVVREFNQQTHSRVFEAPFKFAACEWQKEYCSEGILLCARFLCGI